MGTKCFMLEPTGDNEVEEFPDGGKVTRPLYRRSDNGELTTLNNAPAGALVWADWYLPKYTGPDGKSLVAVVWADKEKTRTTTWAIDGVSSNGNRPWTRTGTPPNVDVNPSIFINQPTGWHGWLRHGELIDA